MPAETACRRYQASYLLLLRFYPRPFRERFRTEMAQTFHDLCRERLDARRGLFGLAFWVYCETFAGIVRENTIHMSQMGKTILRVALVSLALLMVPLVASRLVAGWNWNPGAFVLVYFLFFATGMAYALIARRMDSWAYKAGVGVALVAGFVLAWSNMVHIADAENPAAFVYHGVLVLGVIGAWLARLEPRGLARTLFAMAAITAVIALVLPSNAPPDFARRIAIGHAGWVVLFTVSGLLFRKASLAQSK